MARKARHEAAASEPARSTRVVWEQHIKNIMETRKAKDAATQQQRTANAHYRAALKNYKNAGGDVDALTAAFVYQQQEPSDIERLFRNINDNLFWLGVEVGTQLGLKLDDEAAAPAKSNGDNGHQRAHAPKRRGRRTPPATEERVGAD